MATFSSVSPDGSVMTKGQAIVIIGAGEAGATLAGELVRLGHQGPVHLVGAEDCTPYERPPLSKAHLEPGDEPPIQPVFPSDLALDGVMHHRGLAAVHIDRAAAKVELSNGTRLAYDRLVLATGAAPRRLSGSDDVAGVHYMRSLGQARALRAALLAGGPIAILGAGFIGLEVAAAARRHGCPVKVIEPQARILARGVDAAIAERVQRLHEENGVVFKLGTGVASLHNDGLEVLVGMTDGETLAVSAVCVGIGAMPELELARGAGLAIDNGIAVDERLTTSDPAILAIGDCCSFPLALYGGRRVRLESWRNARDQAAIAAAVLTGGDVPALPAPWFWSDQYDHGLQVAGLVDESTHSVSRIIGDSGLLTFHLAADGWLVAACGFGPGQTVARDIRLAEMLIARAAHPDPAQLADPAVKLKSLL